MKKEFESLRGEEVEAIEDVNGFSFYVTPSHGFLAIPKSSLYYNLAYRIQTKSGYGYHGWYGVYLEEDCQAPEFLSRLPKGTAITAQL